MTRASDRPASATRAIAIPSDARAGDDRASAQPFDPGAAGSSGVHSALRPRDADGVSAATPPSIERILRRLSDAARDLDPHATEARVVQVYHSVLGELLPRRTLRIEIVERARAASESPDEAVLGGLGDGVDTIVVTEASDELVDVSIVIAPLDARLDLSRDEAIARAVAPFLAAAIRTARVAGVPRDAGASRAQLLRADKLATIGQFAAEIVHEFNNPLTAIVTYADVLGRRAGQDPADQRRLQRIGESALRLRDLSRRLLEYARPASEVDPSVSIAEVLHQAVTFCEHVLAQTGTTISVTTDDRLPAVRAVRGELAQVFVNLITNACHAIDGERGHVALSATRSTAGGVRIVVEDNGRGIAAPDLPHIFEPFFTTKGGSGTGLGLAIVQRVLSAHGGACDVESEPGRGTRFIVDLPPAMAVDRNGASP